MAWLMHKGQQFAFQNDEWDWLLHRRGASLGVFLRPHNEHLSALPILAYKAFFQIFGASSTFPYRLLAAVLATTCATLAFVLVARRLGAWVAVAVGAILLFFGPGWNDILWGFQIGYLGSLAAGLGAFAALERGDRAGDAIACVLLIAALASSSVGLTVLVGVLVEVGLRARERGWARLWVVAVPTALYALWYAKYGVSSVQLSLATNIPTYSFQGLAATAGSITGLAQPDGVPYAVTIDPGSALAVGLLVAFAWRVVRGWPFSSRFWAVVAVPAAFWTAAALSYVEGRAPNSSRYVYVIAPFVILAVVECWPRGFGGARGLGLLYAVSLVAIVSNLGFLREGANLFNVTSQYAGAELGAMDVARDVVAPTFRPEDPSITAIIGVHNMVPIDAKSYFSATDKFGSQADSVAAILRQPDAVREAADLVLAKAERLRLTPAQLPARGCVRELSANGYIDLSVGAGQVFLATETAASNVALRRFADTYNYVALGAVSAGRTVALSLPRDRSSLPWHVRVLAAGPATVCTYG